MLCVKCGHQAALLSGSHSDAAMETINKLTRYCWRKICNLKLGTSWGGGHQAIQSFSNIYLFLYILLYNLFIYLFIYCLLSYIISFHRERDDLMNTLTGQKAVLAEVRQREFEAYNQVKNSCHMVEQAQLEKAEVCHEEIVKFVELISML